MKLRFERAEGEIKIGDAVFNYKQLTPGEVNTIRMRCIKDEQFNDTKFIGEMFVAACTGWSGITDGDDNPVECTEEKRIDLFDFNPQIGTTFINSYNQELVQGAEAERKN